MASTTEGASSGLPHTPANRLEMMMKFHRKLSLVLFLALSIAPLGALRAQAIVKLVLRVHVSLSNFGGAYVDSAAVFCKANSTSQPTITVTSPDTAISLLQTGSYGGDVDVRITLTPHQLGEQWNYQCGLKAYSEQWGWGVAGVAPWLQPAGPPSVVVAYGSVQAY
jgi:hypothetical protein